MAIKGGQILHVAGQSAFVVDRIQTAGVTGINVNEERLEELGNYEATGTVRDIPDLTFEMESFDVTTELESLIVGGTNIEADGTMFDLTTFQPLNILSPFKTTNLFTTEGSILIPALSLESMSYNFSLTDNATMTATFRGDSVFYGLGTVWEDKFNGTGAQTVFSFVNGPAYKSAIGGDDYYGLSVDVFVAGRWIRQRLGTDYTNTNAGITFITAPATGTGNVRVAYISGDAQSYLQAVHNVVSPAAVRGRDVSVRVSDGAATPTWTTWLGLQSGNVDWRVTLERDEEMGNSQVVAQDYDTPEVSGSLTMKPANNAALFTQIQRIAGLSSTDIANATADPPELDLEFKVADPATGLTMKTLIVRRAKFVLPQIQGSVGAKLETDFAFTSASGVLEIYKADP